MREIMFRGKRIDNGEWVYGCLIKVTLNGKTAHLIFGDNFSFDGNDVKALSHALVDPSTAGQYTGLTDKNSTKIFEGDFLNGFHYPFLCGNAHNYFAEVVWFENSPAFGLYTHKNPLSAASGISEGDCDYIEDFDDSQWEVIGNIHDNPELLKEG